MDKLLVAIDGACRRNGKPDCVASGGVFVQRFSADGEYKLSSCISEYECKSTNQRGELLALLIALDYIYTADAEAIIITDSEYIFNAMTKEWYNKWANNNWCTAVGDRAKNVDIWKEIKHTADACASKDISYTFYHIKGHVIPYGKVTADRLLKADNTGSLLCRRVKDRYDELLPTKEAAINAAQILSEKNNGYRLSPNTIRDFVVANVVVDAIATQAVEMADARP